MSQEEINISVENGARRHNKVTIGYYCDSFYAVKARTWESTNTTNIAKL